MVLEEIGDVDLFLIQIVIANVSDSNVDPKRAFHLKMLRAQVALKFIYVVRTARLIIVVWSEIVYETQVQVEQMLIDEHKAANLAAKLVVDRSQRRRRRHFH